MSTNNVPDWYYEARKAISWLEEKRSINDDFYSPLSIALGSKVSLDIVNRMIAESGELIERKGKRVRFNLDYQIKHALRQNIESGMMEEVSPGQFRLTEAGHLYAQYLIMTDPEAQELVRRLMGG